MSGEWNSRRSVCYSTKGAVACSQPLASQVGVKILQDGGYHQLSEIIIISQMYINHPP